MGGASTEMDATIASAGVTYDDSTVFDGATAISVSSWCYIDGTGSTTDAIFAKWNNSLRSFLFEVNPTGNVPQLFWPSPFPSGNFNFTLPTGSWSFISLCCDLGSNTYTAFQDGVAISGETASGTAPASIAAGDSNITVGRRDFDNASLIFDGKLAYIQSHTKVISLNEHLEMMYKPGSVTDQLVWYAPLVDDNRKDLYSSVSGTTVSGTTFSNNGPPVQFY